MSARHHKLPTTRVYDDDGYRLRAETICFRDKSLSEVLLISSRNHEGCWSIPGGGLEPGETPEVAALRELLEEAMVEGYIFNSVGTFEDAVRKTRTTVFRVIVTKELVETPMPHENWRTKRWFTLDEAFHHLQQRGYAKLPQFHQACFPSNSSIDFSQQLPPSKTFSSASSSSCSTYPPLALPPPLNETPHPVN